MTFRALLARADSIAKEHLGEPLQYEAASGLTVVVRGVFDAAYVRVDAGLAGVSTCGPAVFLRLEELPADPEIDEPKLTINAAEYRVREVQKDGLGGVLLLLHRT
jgi:hypothetical protein